MRRSDGWRGVRRLGAAVASGLLLVALNAGPGAAAPSPAPASPGAGVIDLTALYHDSRDGLYRTPGGAVRGLAGQAQLQAPGARTGRRMTG